MLHFRLKWHDCSRLTSSNCYRFSETLDSAKFKEITTCQSIRIKFDIIIREDINCINSFAVWVSRIIKMMRQFFDNAFIRKIGEYDNHIEFITESSLINSCNVRAPICGNWKCNTQIFHLDVLLDTGRNTSTDIAIVKFEVACRVLKSIIYKLNHVTTYEDILKKCHFSDSLKDVSFLTRRMFLST